MQFKPLVWFGKKDAECWTTQVLPEDLKRLYECFNNHMNLFSRCNNSSLDLTHQLGNCCLVGPDCCATLIRSGEGPEPRLASPGFQLGALQQNRSQKLFPLLAAAAHSVPSGNWVPWVPGLLSGP
eukprot:970544-Pelagomonas_calceolata.AAC.1